MDREGNDYFEFGNKLFGPFLYGFICWLRKQIQRKKFDHIFFFSRDGYMMKLAYDILEDKEPLNIFYQYVYFSRKSLRQALFWHITDYEDSLKYLGWERYLSVAELLYYYGFSLNEIELIAETEGIDKTRKIRFEKINCDEEMRGLYYKYKKNIDSNSLVQYNFLLDYLKQINMKGSCAVVDIGWHGNMQFYLEEMIRIAKLDAVITGFYVGITPRKGIKTPVHGFIYDQEHPRKRKALLCFFGELEKFFQSSENSVESYEIKEGVVYPKLEIYEDENQIEISSNIKKLQEGAITYIKASKDGDYSEQNLMKMAATLIRVGKYPSYKVIKMFSGLYIMDGEKNFFIPQKPIYLYNLKEFLYELSNSTWKTAYMRAAFKLPFPYYIIYFLLRR